MKKFSLVFVLCLALVINLVACGSGSEASSAPAAASTASTATAESTGSAAAVATDSAFPEQDITMIIPFGAGGAADTTGRIVAMAMDDVLDVRVNAINMAGASGTTGGAEVLDADPDGYTILFAYGGYPIANLLDITEFTYNDFEPVTLAFTNEMGLYTSTSGQYDSLESLIEAAKAAPGEIKVGAGMGTVAHFATLALELYADIDVQIVEVGGDVPKEPELLAGRIDAFFDTFGTVNQYVEAGDFQIISTFGQERNTFLPDVPTAIESGYDIELMQHWGIWAPKGTPADVLDAIHNAIVEGVSNPEYEERISAQMLYESLLPQEDYLTYLEGEFALYEEVAETLL